MAGAIKDARPEVRTTRLGIADVHRGWAQHQLHCAPRFPRSHGCGQFVDPSRGHVSLQLALLGTICIAIALLSAGAWAVASGAARQWLGGSPPRLEWLSGTGGLMLIGLGVGLILTGRKA